MGSFELLVVPGKMLTYPRTTLKGGIGGGLAGLAFGALGVYAAGARYPAFRQLTVPLRAFLMTSAGTFSGTKLHFLFAYTAQLRNFPGPVEKSKKLVPKRARYLRQ